MQELFPQKESEDSEEVSAYRPTTWPGQKNSADKTKYEHPATFEEAIPTYSYPAQDRPRHAQETASHTAAEPAQTNSGRQVPRWARPQQNRSIWKILMLLVVIIALINIAPWLIGIIVAAVGIGLLLILAPIFIVLGILIAIALVIIVALSLLGVPVGRYLFRRKKMSR